MKHVCVIAEAGVNHNGSIELAKQLVLNAKEAGADYVKFQTFIPEKLVSKFADKAEYQKTTTGTDESQLDMLKKLALTYSDFENLKLYCEEIGIGFISTPFDLDSIDFLESLNMDFWKIPSGEITNLPYLVKIAKTGRKIVMSTGMCNIDEVKDAVRLLEENGAGDIVLLHCNTQYPTPFEDVNLSAMNELASLGKDVGYSDHTEGIEVPIAAVAMGATIIEKHFTLDRNMEGPDHKASLEPEMLKEMVDGIRNIEKAIGNGKKERSNSESKNVDIARKSIVAKTEIKKGDIFTEENLTTKRPGSGISPMKWYKLLGKVAKHSYCVDEVLNKDEI